VAESAGLTADEAVARAAERGDHPDDERKDDPLDVPVWQASTGDAPAWDSPWGRGRPGWHAECSAMAIATLGTGIDLHCGGADLAFPHHAYEAAQAEAALGVRPFARAWLRPGTVLRHGEKMSKSTGNLVFVHDVLEEWSSGAVRLAVLDRPWAADWEFGNDVLDRAEDRLQRLRGLATHPGGRDAEGDVVARLADDLDVSGALDVAEEAGGAAAELLIEVLGLRHHEAVARSSLVPSP
jgi:cysteinyl-tRNA synthetase